MTYSTTRFAWLTLLPIAAALPGCEPYRIEYHSRPGYYDRLVDAPMDDRVELEDGTVLVYNTLDAKGESTNTLKTASGDESDVFRIRREADDGVTLHAFLPDHVLANMLKCLRDREYDLLWDELVAERTKPAYAERGMDGEQFAAFCEKYRMDLSRMVNRMRIGLATHEVVVEGKGDGVIECRFWPQDRQALPLQEDLHGARGVRAAVVDDSVGVAGAPARRAGRSKKNASPGSAKRSVFDEALS